ncbi:MAG: hypothetical protein V4489_05695 [Chlamydiota bacterium]
MYLDVLQDGMLYRKIQVRLLTRELISENGVFIVSYSTIEARVK